MSKASGGGSSKGGASKSRGKDSKDVITKVVDHTRNVAISHPPTLRGYCHDLGTAPHRPPPTVHRSPPIAHRPPPTARRSACATPQSRNLLTKGEKLFALRNALFDDDPGGFGAERDVTRWVTPFKSYNKNGLDLSIEVGFLPTAAPYLLTTPTTGLPPTHHAPSSLSLVRPRRVAHRKGP